MRTFGAMVVVATLAWTAGRLRSEPRVEMATAPVPLAEVVAVEAVDVPRVAVMTAALRESRSTRNLFAYREDEPRAVQTVVPLVTVAPQPARGPEVRKAPEPAAVQQRAFPYRYLGRFGPDGNPLAAFSHNGEVVVRRAGDAIDEHFVLLGIGSESVEVGEGTPRVARRVPIGE